jgi:NTP pyrophosphatase (non-canonical NTP hydrolase)
VRHGSYPDSSEAHELADVFLYVVHMANVLDLDLANIVRDKEIVNLQKFLAR